MAGFSIASYGLYLYLAPLYGNTNAILAVGGLLLIAGSILTFALPHKQPSLEEKVVGTVKDWNEKLHLPDVLEDIKKMNVSHFIEDNIKKILLFSLIVGIAASKYNHAKKGQENENKS